MTDSNTFVQITTPTSGLSGTDKVDVTSLFVADDDAPAVTLVMSVAVGEEWINTTNNFTGLISVTTGT